MAGALTHLMICKVAMQSKALAELKDLVYCVTSFPRTTLLGAVSPDLPYLSLIEEATHKRSWADYMHYIATNGVVVNGIRSIRPIWNRDDERIASRFAWLLGYASHLIIDATIHPIVEAIVGPFGSNKTNHFLCEQTQDILTFRDIEGREVVGSDFISSAFDLPEDTLLFWRSLLLKTYFRIDSLPKSKKKTVSSRPQKTIPDIVGKRIRICSLEESLSTKRWGKWYKSLLDLATEGKISWLSRSSGLIPDIIRSLNKGLYGTSDSIPSGYRTKYYSSVTLPKGKGRGNFIDEGFTRAVNNVVIGWKHLHDVLVGDSDNLSYFNNWNLDTGIVNGTKEMTFWA